MANQDHRPVIFLAFANEQDHRVAYLRQLPAEARQLRQTLEQAEQAGLCRLVLRTNATAGEILDVFQQQAYRNQIAIFHYGGHANGYQLLLESASGQTLTAAAGGLAAFLGQQLGLQLVFLNGCSTQQQVEGLLQASVPAVIATSRAIEDEVARDFAHRFYRGLASGANLQTAYNEAVAALQMVTGNTPRALYWGQADDAPGGEPSPPDRWPWDLTIRPGAELVARWDLPTAVDNPLFDLPPLPPLDPPPEPFRYLNWFSRADAPVFFGRGYEIRELYHQITGGDAPLLLLYGQSGVGKTSLLAAGLFPRLERDAEICYARRSVEQGLTGALQTLLQADAPTGDSLAAAWLEQERQLDRPLVIILDQVEEVFTRPRSGQPPELDALVQALQPIFADPNHRPRGKLILGFRKEWLAEIESKLKEQRLYYFPFPLQRLARRGIIAAVEGVARRNSLPYRLTIDDTVAGVIADDLLADPASAIAPTLQILLTDMWRAAKERRPDAPRFDLPLYQNLAREGILLEDFLTKQLDRLAAEQPAVVESGLPLDVLAYHTTPLGTADQHPLSHLLARYAHVPEQVSSLIRQCKEELYLLVEPASERAQTEPVSRLAHDALAPLVRHRFDASGRPGQLARRILENRAWEWADEKSGVPLDEQDLALVEQGRDGMRDWTPAEQRLVAASRQARAERRSRRQMLWGAGLTAVLLIVLFAGVAWWQWAEAARREAEAVQQASLANSGKLAIESAQQISDDRHDLALLLAIEAAKIANTAEADAALRRALAYNIQTRAILGNHQAEVRAAAWIPDARRLAAGGVDGVVRIWPATAASNEQPDATLTGHTAAINTLAWSPDGSRLLTASDDGTARIWNLETAAGEVVLNGHTAAVIGAAWNPAGSMVVTASHDNTARIWDAASGIPLATLAGHSDWVTFAGWNGDGSRLATTSYDGTARVWNGFTGAFLGELAGHEGRMLHAAWAWDTVRLAIAGADGIAQIWDSVTLEPLQDLKGHTAALTRVAWFENRLLTASEDGTARVWNSATGAELAALGHQADTAVLFAAWNGDGSRIITTGEDGLARLWNPDGEQLGVLAGHTGAALLAAWNGSGGQLATASADGTVRIWEAARGGEAALLAGHMGAVRFAAWDAAGGRVATAGFDNTARLWAAETGAELAVLSGHTGPVRRVAWNPGGDSLLTASFDGTARIWEAASGDELVTLSGHTDRLWAAVWNSDGSQVATASSDGTARVWEAETGNQLAVLAAHTRPVIAVAWGPDGQRLATSGEDNTARVWEAATGEELATLAGHTETVADVAWNGDGTKLLTASFDGTARIWDAASGKLLLTLTGHTGRVVQALWSPDDRRVLTASDDNTARIWEAATGVELAVLAGHSQPLQSAAWSHDAARVVTASDDGTARIWDAVSGSQLAVLTGHTAGQFHAAWSPDDRYVVTSGRDNTARIHAVDMDVLLGLGCQRAARNLTPAEWEQFIDFKPAEPVCNNLPFSP